MNKTLFQVAADLFVKSKEDEELSSKIQRLRDEIKKVIESEDSIFGKFRGLVESFQDIIPEEKQRYNAAIQALSTTSKLSQQEIVKAVNNQLEELKILEKGLMPSLPAWRNELKIMEARSREMRDEISKLRDKIGQLESEEKGILTGMAAREKEMALVEKAVGELFADIAAEITSIKKKVEEFTAESTASQSIPPRDSIKRDIPIEEKGDGEQKSEIRESPAEQNTEWQKKCPMCGGRMDFYTQEEMWQCYSCAYEELKKDEVQDESEEKGEHANAPAPVPVSKPSSGPSPLRAVHLGSLSSDEDQESKKRLSPSISQPSSKKKTCPVCRKKMDWYESEKAWRCPFCDYERSI
jgi:ribosomal protein L37AE/L43A/predicted  nucleic acid-binding Zn-ribbon protein